MISSQPERKMEPLDCCTNFFVLSVGKQGIAKTNRHCPWCVGEDAFWRRICKASGSEVRRGCVML